ncbi:MAG TPA: 50S ribosomal protein L7/L12 [Gemmataceae bacterium]|nr:50S ribosomal protein L7/L12 [Gemmataceae bacterium]
MAEGNEPSFAADIMELGDKIAALTITKAVQLKEYLKEKYKIEPAAGGVVMAAGPGGGGGGGPAEKPAEQTEFTVILEGLADPAKKINVIKVVREITQLGLKEAKELVEGAPKPVKENVAKDEANNIKKKLEEGGAKASLK